MTLAPLPRLLAALLLAALLAPLALAQTGTAFSFQGRLYDSGVQAHGEVLLRITPWDSESGGIPLASPLETGPLALEEGVFTTTLDFGPTVFLGTPVWLAIEADTGTGYVLLEPRQAVVPTPYAMHAESVAVDGVDEFALQDGAVSAAKIAPGAVGSGQVNASEVQRRIAPDCAAGMAIAGVAEDGTTTCVSISGEEGDWELTGSGALYTDSRVRVGGLGPTAPKMIIHANSSIAAPQLDLRETELDYARLNFTSEGTPEGGTFHTGFWSIAARTRPTADGGPAADQVNFFNSRSGDAMTLYGNGWMGLGPAAFTPDAPLMVTTNGFYAPGIGPHGRGDLYIGNGSLGLSFGVATGGGGTGAARIWTDGGLVDQLFLGSAAHGDVLAIKDERVGVGTTDPQAELDVDGVARVRSLADASATLNRSVRVDPDGDLVAGELQWHAVPGSAFHASTNTTAVQRHYNTLRVPTATSSSIYAPLELPHGTRVTGLRLVMVDNAASSDYTAYVIRSLNDSNSHTAFLGTPTAGADPAIRAFDSPPQPALVIDNETATYTLWVYPHTGTWQDAASELRNVRLQLE